MFHGDDSGDEHKSFMINETTLNPRKRKIAEGELKHKTKSIQI
jgi:hypothetical protein